MIFHLKPIKGSLSFCPVTYVSSWIRLVSTIGSIGGLLLASATALFSSPFSFALVSDLWEPDEEDGRSSSGLGCIKVNGNSATNSLQTIELM